LFIINFQNYLKQLKIGRNLAVADVVIPIRKDLEPKKKSHIGLFYH